MVLDSSMGVWIIASVTSASLKFGMLKISKPSVASLPSHKNNLH